MFSTDPYLPQTPPFDFNKYLIPCTAKCIHKQTESLIIKIRQAYNEKLHLETLEKKLIENLMLSERDILNPDDPQFEDMGFPGHWINYRFKDERRDRGNFMDFIKIGANSHKIISLDCDPLAQALFTLQPGDHFSIIVGNKKRDGIVQTIHNYKTSKCLLKAHSCISARN